VVLAAAWHYAWSGLVVLWPGSAAGRCGSASSWCFKAEAVGRSTIDDSINKGPTNCLWHVELKLRCSSWPAVVAGEKDTACAVHIILVYNIILTT
jgi:hypothetical protein